MFNRDVHLSDIQKRDLLTRHVMPSDNFEYPFGQKPSQKVYLSKVHITGKNNAFKYSFHMKGVICIPCVLFGPKQVENDRGKITKLSNFVNEPFCKYAKISERINDHLTINYHRWAQERADTFLQVSQTPGTSVIDQVDEDHKRQVLENRMRLY